MDKETAMRAMKNLLIKYTEEDSNASVTFSAIRDSEVAMVQIEEDTLLINLDTLYQTVVTEANVNRLREEAVEAILELRLFQIVDKLNAGALATSVYLTL